MMVRPPQRCGNGHRLEPGRVLVGSMVCACGEPTPDVALRVRGNQLRPRVRAGLHGDERASPRQVRSWRSAVLEIRTHPLPFRCSTGDDWFDNGGAGDHRNISELFTDGRGGQKSPSGWASAPLAERLSGATSFRKMSGRHLDNCVFLRPGPPRKAMRPGPRCGVTLSHLSRRAS
jgi:hypothetical protein